MALKAHLEPIAALIQNDALNNGGNNIQNDEGDQPRDQPRRQPRRTLRLEVSGAVPGGAEANVTIHNISAAGLLIETDLPLKVGETLAIDLPQAGPVGAEIVWESEHLYGCAFQQALGEAELAAAQLRGDAGAGAGAGGSGTGGSGAGGLAADRPFEGLGGTADEPLGLRINRLRRERSLTLAQVAAALGVSKPTVWAWEKGKARPLPERLEAIAAALSVPLEDLTKTGAASENSGLIEECRLRIAAAYGITPHSIRIMIEV